MSYDLDFVCHVTLPRSIATYETDDFEAELVNELEMKEAALPLQAFCDEGGRPDKVGFKLNSCNAEHAFIRLVVSVDFEEVVPSSCHDRPYIIQRFGEIEILLDRDSGESEIRPIYNR